jgi:hypothetical protein
MWFASPKFPLSYESGLLPNLTRYRQESMILVKSQPFKRMRLTVVRQVAVFIWNCHPTPITEAAHLQPDTI